MYDHDDDKILFSYNSGRWLWGEKHELQRRFLRFNISALKDVATRSGEANNCIELKKLPEGLNNKSYLLRLGNGRELVAKLPNPFIPAGVATASEAATLDFLRNVMGLPVPRLLTYCNIRDNTVGSEYIIMEKAAGEELTVVWPDMDFDQRSAIVSAVADFQAKLSTIDMHHIGSLYYTGDVKPYKLIQGQPNRFCIGPVASIKFWEGERTQLDVDRGPFSSPHAYMKAVVDRERAWLKLYARPHNVDDFRRQSDEQESPDAQVRVLERYLGLSRYLVPDGDDRLLCPVLLHQDLNSGNVFVQDGKLTSIIDWQGSVCLPLYFSYHIPRFLSGDKMPLHSLPDLSGLSAMEKDEIWAQYQLTKLQKLFGYRSKDTSPVAFQALADPRGASVKRLVTFSGSTWDDDGLFLLRESVQQAWKNGWFYEKPKDIALPAELAHSEDHWEEQSSWNSVQDFFNAIGVPADGFVSHEEFAAKSKVLLQMVEMMIEQAQDKEEARRAMNSWELTDPSEGALPGDVKIF